MAEGLLKQLEGFEVYSAGINPAEQIDPFAVQVMQELGIDIAEQQPKTVERFLTQQFDYVITVCDSARETCPLFSGIVANRIHLGFEDPHGLPLEKFRQVRDEIREKITELVQQIRD
jgi:arsenate reductase